MNRLFVAIIFVLLSCSPSFSATIWCNPDNSGAEDGAAKATGYNTLWEAIDSMNGGDTVIIANGDWQNTAGMSIDTSHPPPSGTAGAYSIIRSETEWGARVHHCNVGVPRSYIEIRGIVFDSRTTPTVNIVYNWSYAKFIRCGFLVGKITGNNHAAGFGSDDSTRESNHHNLMEECISWGGGRYMFYSKYGQYNIFRRCAVRHDNQEPSGAQDDGQIANFRAYACNYHYYQNCISIDSDRIEYYNEGVLNPEASGYWIGDQYGATGNVITGSISIKDIQQAFYIGGKNQYTDINYINNSSAINLSVAGGATLSGMFVKSGNSYVDGVGINLLGINALVANQNGIMDKNGGIFTVSNSIISDIANYGLYSVDVKSSYINYHDLGLGILGSVCESCMTYDPLTNGLLYPVRIESESPLATSGYGGGQVGPTILKKIGVSGTLYGEDGWDTVTSENLWPFPNEAKIKELMSTTVDGVSGAYGFTTGNSIDGSAQTLTKYIWEQLGNQIPPEIYGKQRYRLGGVAVKDIIDGIGE